MSHLTSEPFTEHLEVSTAPTFNNQHPVEIHQLKPFLKVTHDESDSELLRMIQAATLREQESLSIQIPEATYILRRDGFDDWMEIPRPPVSAISSVKYLDSNGVETTLATTIYRTIQLNTRRQPAVVTLAFSQFWPTTRGIERDVWITFVCGWSSGNVPQDAAALIMHAVDEEYYGRENPSVIARLRGNLMWRNSI